MGEFFNDGSVPDEVKDALIEQMVDEAQKSRGLTPAHLGPYLEKIKDKTNRDWRMMMRGLGRSTHIKITRSWVKWNKRNPSLSMPLRPGKYFKSLPKVLVMADTSGSIGDGELLHFIKEINGLCERCIIDMAWVDAHFDEDDPAIFHRDIKNARDFHKRAQEPVGRGGTYFDEFYKYAIKHYGEYQHVLMLTDGYSDYIPQRLVPGQQLALMTPMHDQRFVEQAQANGFKVAVIEDLP
jgi:predicted metal-dependent peptidase